MEKTAKTMGIAPAAREVPCSEGTMRRMEKLGIVHPVRDQWGRRLYGQDDISGAREHLSRNKGSQAA